MSPSSTGLMFLPRRDTIDEGSKDDKMYFESMEYRNLYL